MISAFTIAEVSQIVGISHRQLEYWDTTGLVQPSLRPASGKGTRRLYSVQDMVELKVVRRLLDGGLSIQRIRKSLDFIRSIAEPVSELVVVSDGETIYVSKSNDFILDTFGDGKTAWKLVIADLLREVEEQISDLIEVAARQRTGIVGIPIGSQVGR